MRSWILSNQVPKTAVCNPLAKVFCMHYSNANNDHGHQSIVNLENQSSPTIHTNILHGTEIVYIFYRRRPINCSDGGLTSLHLIWCGKHCAIEVPFAMMITDYGFLEVSQVMKNTISLPCSSLAIVLLIMIAAGYIKTLSGKSNKKP